MPALYLQQDETAVAITLLHIATQGWKDLSRISIDVRDQSYIEHVLNDLEHAISYLSSIY